MTTLQDVIDGARPIRFARHAGMDKAALPLPAEHVAEACAKASRRERQILGALLVAQREWRLVVMLSRKRLGASNRTLEAMYYAGWINGAGSPDARGTGNTPDSSWWWLTERGEQIAKVCGFPPKGARHE